MHTAVRAKGLGFHKGAFITALHRILRKCFAFGTKIFLCPMLLSTIKSYHQSDGTLFPFSLALNFIYHNFSPFSFSKSLSDKQKIKCILQFSHKVPLNIPAFCRLYSIDYVSNRHRRLTVGYENNAFFVLLLFERFQNNTFVNTVYIAGRLVEQN